MRGRSPNYPTIELSAAVDHIKKVFKAEGRSEMTSEAVAKAIGYNSLNGKSRSVIAALKQYGLIDFQRGDSGGKISQRGLGVAVMPESSPEYRQALKDAALEPSLFAELYENRKDASETNLASFLMFSKDFTQDGAERASKVFKSAIALANLDESDNISGQEDGYFEDNFTDYEDEQMQPSAQQPKESGIAKITRRSSGPFEQYSWKLSKNLTAEVTFTGGGLTAKGIDMLMRYLDLMKDAIDEQEDELEEEDADASHNFEAGSTPVRLEG